MLNKRDPIAGITNCSKEEPSFGSEEQIDLTGPIVVLCFDLLLTHIGLYCKSKLCVHETVI